MIISEEQTDGCQISFVSSSLTIYTAVAEDAKVDVDDIEDEFAAGRDVIVENEVGTGGEEPGVIELIAPLTLNGGHDLTLKAADDLILGAPLTMSAAGADLFVRPGARVSLWAPVTTGGEQEYGGEAEIVSDPMLSAGGEVRFLGPIIGVAPLTVSAPSTVFGGNVGEEGPLAAITVSGGTTTIEAAQVRTSGDIALGDVALAADTTLRSDGGDLTLGGVDGAHALALESGGVTTLAEPVGATTPLGSLAVGDGGTTVIDGGVRTTGDQTYPEPVTLTEPSTFSSSEGELEASGPLGLGAFAHAIDAAGELSGPVSGSGSVSKEGPGTLELSGTNNFAGTFAAAGGRLVVTGDSGAASFALSGGTLGGTGTAGAVSGGSGILSPGLSPGMLHTGSLALGPGDTVALELNDPTPGPGYDRLAVTGTVALDDAALSASLGFAPRPGETFTVIDNDGGDPVAGTFARLPEGALADGGGDLALRVGYAGGDGNDVTLTAVPIPPPASPASAGPLATPPFLKLRILRTTIRRLLKTGRLRVRVRVGGATKLSLEARAMSGPIGRGRIGFATAGAKTATIRLSRSGRHRLSRLRRVRIKVVGKATDVSGRASVASTTRRVGLGGSR